NLSRTSFGSRSRLNSRISSTTDAFAVVSFIGFSSRWRPTGRRRQLYRGPEDFSREIGQAWFAGVFSHPMGENNGWSAVIRTPGMCPTPASTKVPSPLQASGNSPMPIQRTSSNRLMVEVAEGSSLESIARSTDISDGLEAVIPAGGSGPPRGWGALKLPTGRPDLHPWDEAHAALTRHESLGLESAPVYAEPDFVQAFPYQGPDDQGLESFGSAGACVLSGPDDFWPPAIPRPTFPFAWHLGDNFSGLQAARDRVGDPTGKRVRIAILDTGYDPEHISLPEHLMTALQWNFVDDNNDARDPNRHFPTNNPGHGTATLALLAGGKVHPAAFPGFDAYLGGAPHAEVVPVRIADSVIHFGTYAIAQGIEYAIAKGCDVVSISMGGVPARSWAAAVNRAYEAGVAIFAAAGNRIGLSPPSTIVYPARFNRVVAVCGVTADRTPYFKAGLHRKMQGCFGPPAKMSTAIAAYTPNTPWSILGCHELITIDGA